MVLAKKENDRYLSNSLVRGLEILKMFSANQPTLSLVEIANHLGVSRTTPYRLLYTLQSVGYIRQDEVTKRYELTPKVLELGFTYLNNLEITDVSRPYLEELRDLTGASAHIGLLDGNDVVYIARVQGKGVATVLNVKVGSRLPIYATAMGKLLLAYQPEPVIENILSEIQLKPFTIQTKTQLMELQNELKDIKQRGYAISNEELESGIFSIAAPIFDNQNQVSLSINIVAPLATFSDLDIEEDVLPTLLKIAKQLSEFNGNHK